jgi:hypothetical protein
MALYVLIRRGGHRWFVAGQNTPLRPTPGTSPTPPKPPPTCPGDDVERARLLGKARMPPRSAWHRPSAGSGWTNRPLVATDAGIVTAMIDDLDRWLSPTPTTQLHRRRARGEAERHR